MKSILHHTLEGLFYVFAFLLIQTIATAACLLIWRDLPTNAVALTVASGGASLLTIVLFAWRRWSPLSRSYLRSRPWGVLVWAVLFSIGTIIPSEWLAERLQLEMPAEASQLFALLMSKPWGYLVVGILAPLAEEMVFRSALLRTLLRLSGRRWHWAAILASAIAFGAVHGNWAQGCHAMLMGLVLGWMYWRTRSIVPGLVLHWVNNTVAYVVFRLMPGLQDANLVDLFGGNTRQELLYVGFSLCVMLPSLYQLHLRLKSAK